MVVYDFNVVRFGAAPAETDAPLIIDPDTVLPGAITFQFLQSIPRRHSQVIKAIGRVEQKQLAQHNYPKR
jgi:hypothetical protein